MATPAHPASPTSPTAPRLKALFRRSRSRPQLAPVVVPPASLDAEYEHDKDYDHRPKSPSVILSPSTPDFPTVGLPPLPAPPQELVAAQVLPLSSDATALARPRQRVGGQKSAMDPTLRHSLALLDERLAEIELLGFGSAASVAKRASWQDGAAALAGLGQDEEDAEERLADEGENDGEGERNVRHSQPIMAPFTTLAAKDTSINSLASLASGTSSSEEDAFDIADFPSLDQLNSSFELGAPAVPVAHRKRSSDLMAFPIPPALPNIPLRRPPEPAVAEDVEEHVFEQLAELGQRGSIQGLGLFSSTATSASPGPSPLLSQGRMSRSSSNSSRTSVSSKSFDASTLASSAANTSLAAREKDDEPFPPELPHISPLDPSLARALRALPQPIDPLRANIGSAHPALASPFAEEGSFPSTTVSRRSSTAPVSPSSAHFAVRSSSLLARVESSASSPGSSRPGSGRSSPAQQDVLVTSPETYGELDLPGIPLWRTSSPHGPFDEADDDEQEELADPQPQVQEQTYEHIRIIEPVAPPHPQAYGQSAALPSSPSSSTLSGTLRRLSSFGLLKKRKSDAVLQQSNTQNSTAPFGLTKRKSEAALSSLLRSSKSSSMADKENSPVLASPPLPQPGPNKLTRRSVSSPKLNNLFRGPASPASEACPRLPTSPSSAAINKTPKGFVARPRTLSFGDSGDEGTSKAKKRFSMYINQLGSGAPGSKDSNGDTVPPLPPTPKEHVPAKAKAPAGMAIDVAKANELDVEPTRQRSDQSPAPTLEISATPSSATGSLLFSPTESSAPGTPISPSFSTFSRAAVPLGEKPLPAPALADALSPDSAYFPPITPTSTHSLSFEDGNSPADRSNRMSLAAFLQATDPDQQLVVKRPQRISSVFQPSTNVFPSSASARTQSQSRASSRAPTPLSPASADEHWSRPTSPALLDALKNAVGVSPLALAPGLDKQVFGRQEVVAFPMRVASTSSAFGSSAPPTTEGDDEGDDDNGSSSGEDDYGTGTDSDSDADDDKPLGVVVPGALTAQKSLRLSAAKKSRSERKAQEQKDKEMRLLAARTKAMLKAQERAGASGSKRREDPFELEHTAAMVATPPRSADGHGDMYAPGPLRNIRPALSPIASVGTFPSSSTITTLQSTGHDSLLPQTDAHIDRRAYSSTGMKRSPSSPLDPMVAESSLTMDSPMLSQEPLPAKSPPAPVPPRPSPPLQLQQSTSSSGRSRAKSVTRSPPLSPGEQPPMPTMRPPPTPPSAGPAQYGRRPSLHPESSSYSSSTPSPNPSPASTPQLSRRPSLHPDAHPHSTMHRQASGSSHKSTTASAGSSKPLARHPTISSRARGGTASSPAVEHKVYLNADASQHLTVQVTDKTTAGEVVAFGVGKGALGKPQGPKEALDGGWALWEVWRSLGLERPIREYEFVADIVKSWDDSSNVLVFRRTPLWPVLSSHARLHPTMPRMGPVQLEVKKGKWSKRFLELKEGALSYSKSEKGKDATILCQLSNFDVFFVSEKGQADVKPPKPFVFALKSRLTRAHFEEKSEWCHFVSIKTSDEALGWTKTILEAGNAVARQREQAVLGSSSAPTATSSPNLSGPLISAAALAAPVVPPVPSLPPTATSNTPAAAIAAAARSGSRPPPPILAQRSNTDPLGASPAVGPQAAALSRNKTVVKPTPREWGQMGGSEKREWVKDSERVAKAAGQKLVDLSR
ncbi:hypothetical protein JCM10207_005323 [Rhodosporidiobolus poonsookiae]